MANRCVKLLSVAVFCVIAWTLFPADSNARSVPVDGYAAIVNERVITVGEVLAMLQPLRQQLETSYEGDELDKKLQQEYENQLNFLIERALILEEFVTMKGELPERAVDDQINTIISDRFHNDRAAFLQALTEDRMTLDEWREETKNRIIVAVMRRREISDHVVVSPSAVRSTYDATVEKYKVAEQIKLRMIVLNKGKTSDDHAVKHKEAEQIHEKIVAGADFVDLAKSSSEGSKAAQGGDLGWLDPTTLRKDLQAVAAKLEPGKISDVVEGEDEFDILKLEGRKPALVTPFSDVQGQIQSDLRKAEEERLYKAWVERLRKKYYVKVFPPNAGL